MIHSFVFFALGILSMIAGFWIMVRVTWYLGHIERLRSHSRWLWLFGFGLGCLGFGLLSDPFRWPLSLHFYISADALIVAGAFGLIYTFERSKNDL